MPDDGIRPDHQWKRAMSMRQTPRQSSARFYMAIIIFEKSLARPVLNICSPIVSAFPHRCPVFWLTRGSRVSQHRSCRRDGSLLRALADRILPKRLLKEFHLMSGFGKALTAKP